MKLSNLHHLVIYLILAGMFSCSPRQNVYYIDGDRGSDTNSGTKPEDAWATLEKVNKHVFSPGDRLLIKAGTEYSGQFNPSGSGAKGKPIRVNSYGDGDKPAIHGEGKYKAAVLLENIEYWEVRNLEITNRGSNREPGRRGLIIRARNFGDCHHIVLDSLEIHNVNGSLVKSKGGGSAIYWRNGGDSIKSCFVDLVIKNCHLYECERNGINSWGYVHCDEWHPSVGVVVKNNLLNEGSPCIDAGKNIAENVIYDFFGNPVSPGEAPDIGIHELK